jgi:hypothetical protein
MPEDARHALLTRLFDHAPTFPPAQLPPSEALAEDRRARASEHAWLLGRLVWPASKLSELPQGKIRCGGERIPGVEELAGLVRGCRERGLVLKATAGLHHAYPTAVGEHGFLNLLAAAVFGDEEDALRARPGAFELDEASFRWDGREAGPERLADVRGSLLHSIGSCSFFEPVEELERLGLL